MCNGNCKCKENNHLFKWQYDENLKVDQLVLAVPEEGKNVKTREVCDIRSEIEEYFKGGIEHLEIAMKIHRLTPEVYRDKIDLLEDVRDDIMKIFDKEV